MINRLVKYEFLRFLEEELYPFNKLNLQGPTKEKQKKKKHPSWLKQVEPYKRMKLHSL